MTDLRKTARELGIPEEVAEAVDADIDRYVKQWKRAALRFSRKNRHRSARGARGGKPGPGRHRQ